MGGHDDAVLQRNGAAQGQLSIEQVCHGVFLRSDSERRFIFRRRASIYTPLGQWWRMKIIKRLPGLPVERALGVLSGRWKAVILHVLLDGPQRTCALEARIAGLSQKVLLEQLRALEEHGMVSRPPSAEHRQGIEYRLTPLGESLRPILESLDRMGRPSRQRSSMRSDRLLPCDAVVRDLTTTAYPVRDVQAVRRSKGTRDRDR